MVLYSEYNWASLSKPGLVGCQAPIAVYVFMYIYIAMYAPQAFVCMYVQLGHQGSEFISAMKMAAVCEQLKYLLW